MAEGLFLIKCDKSKLPPGATILKEMADNIAIKSLIITQTVDTETRKITHRVSLEFIQGDLVRKLNLSHRLQDDLKKAVADLMNHIEIELNSHEDWQRNAV